MLIIKVRMILKCFLLICIAFTFICAQNTTCPTTEPRKDQTQCYTYPRISCVSQAGVYSNITSLFIGNSSRVTLETELRLFQVLYSQFVTLGNSSNECQRFFQTLACLYLYTPCEAGRPLRFCDASFDLIKNSMCRPTTTFFSVIAMKVNDDAVFSELRIPTGSTLNARVDGYPRIDGIDYNQTAMCTYVGSPGATNADSSGKVKLVTNSTYGSINVFDTSDSGVVQVLSVDAEIWGDVCIDEAMSEDEMRNLAKVVCRSIGFPSGYLHFYVAQPVNSSGYYMIDKIRCNGNESSLSACDHNGYHFKYCAPNRRFYVACNTKTGTVGLYDEIRNDNSLSGFPKITLENSAEAQFCADTFTNALGTIICNSLENPRVNTMGTISMVENNGSIADLVSFNCTGNETRVLQCQMISEMCSNNMRVRLSCKDKMDIIDNTKPDLFSKFVTPVNIISIVASVIIIVLILVILAVICFFYSYRKDTLKKIQNSELRASNTGVFYMQHLDCQGSIPRIVNNGIYTENPVGFNQENPGLHVNIPNSTTAESDLGHIPGSPIQNYMVTTLGADSLPTDHILSINFLQDYCGADICSYVIPGARLEMGDKLGEGAFGIVYKGRILDRFEGEHDEVEAHAEVAVKTLKDPGNDHELKDLLIECNLLRDLQHTNILGLLAVTYFGNRPYLIIPYMANGDLKGYLKGIRVRALNSLEWPEELSEQLLARMTLDIAKGMEHLTNKRYVHRDLAARNCMVDANFSIKVSDFGLSREIYIDDYYRQKGGKLPAKWMAPECLGDGISNEKTDVWSFGVTLWEVYSLGRNPYPGVGNSEMFCFLDGGKRMEQPKLCPVIMYELMQYCWQHKPLERPTFTIITNYLESLKFGRSDQTEPNMVTRDAIQEEEEKLHGIEYTEDIPDRKLHRQDAFSLKTSTPYTASKPVCFEHLASRIEETTRKAFLMHCLKSVSMDSNRFEAGGYIIPHLSMSIPILDEEQRERTKSLATVRTKHTFILEQKKRHTVSDIACPEPIKEETLTKSILTVPSKNRRPSNSARARWRSSAHKGKSGFFFHRSTD